MDTKEFFDNLDISPNDRLKAENHIKAKGLFFHLQIKQKLFAWTEENSVKYSQIASYYRYDKRIRLVLYKYIAYLEEYYRASILDAYYDNTDQDFWIPEIREELRKNIKLDSILQSLGFKELIKQMKKMPDDIKQKCSFSKRKRLIDNAYSLKELRNSVMHNRFLLMYRGFAMCYLDNGKKGASLRDNIINLISFLPEDVGKKCKDDICKCAENRNTEQDTQWDLPEQAIVSLG